MRATALAQTFLPADFSVDKWEDLQSFYDELLRRPLPSVPDLEQWLQDRSDLNALVSETFAWRYIKIASDSNDQNAQTAYHNWMNNIAPQVRKMTQLLDQKTVEHPLAPQLDSTRYSIYLRSIHNTVELYDEDNIRLETEVQLNSKEHGKIFSAMTIGHNGAQLTLQQAGTLLEEPLRQDREAVYHKINQRILQDTAELEDLFDVLLAKRHRIAVNAGFNDYRDYCFRKLARFDYSAEDCLAFHEVVRTEILPLVEQLNRYRKEALGVGQLRPWDLHVDSSGAQPLRPFSSMDDLLAKATRCLNRVHPQFGEVLTTMKELGHLDLASRPGKRPGGFNMPLLKSGIPFIFMNASSSLADMRTLLHESGHAIHSCLTRDLPLSFTRRVPSEVAELAAMSMELLTMDHWDIFFPDPNDLRRARLQQLENVLKILPWIATIDKFQHWLYTNPGHSRAARRKIWLQYFRAFNSSAIDHDGLEEYAAHLWLKQLHLFEVPFYYIEYGIAQLGAIALWQQYREQPAQTVERYRSALRLGYTRNVRDIYKMAGITFDFSRNYVHQLGQFIKAEIDQLL